jgi:hypothetical protein
LHEPVINTFFQPIKKLIKLEKGIKDRVLENNFSGGYGIVNTEVNASNVVSHLTPRLFNPKECEHALPYMVDNGVLDIYRCKRFRGNCYFEPKGGKPFKKICD